ncbi:hypothetical protein [Marinifilum caeruleilacunae]|uniref:Uncharacterized protein n=1 Tax=Marinifilum caeruleilacunae TaxID=2499076 RepID=A0ABX1WYM2_9BACT|nr:hypothetical protein [Marinifilum caeruleilacunae]NOU60994.1 hypothetical protein [Marinifilum caeruleilacunae]
MKRLLKITFVLAISLIAFGTYAQDATHAVGSLHKFKVNGGASHLADHVGNTYTWAVYQSDGTTPATATDFVFATTETGVDVNMVDIRWLKAGTFFVEVTEANGAGACTTLRRLEILVSAGAIDLLVLASNDSGTEVSGAGLTTCNDSSGAIIDNATSNFGNSARYFTVSMSTDGQAWTSGEWGFDFATLAGATVTTTTAGVTVGATTINVPTGESTVTFKVEFANTPGPSPANDITLGFVASNAFITTAGGNTSEDGTNLANNTPAQHVIKASPNTSVITID